jgi:hypothetical protein
MFRVSSPAADRAAQPSTFKKSIQAAVISAGLMLTAHSAMAVTYTEVGDAGDLVHAAAQAVTGNAGDAITAIKGTLTKTAGISEADAYKIYISSPSTFSASTTGFTLSVNNFDTQLFLFTLGGIGIVASDDDPVTGGPQSIISAGNSFTSALTAGYYYLMITGGSQFPASTLGTIFPNWTDGTTDPTMLVGPTGPGGASPISTFSGNSNDGGVYSIALTGVTIAAVPEPGSVALMLAGGLAVAGAVRRRSKSRNEQALA